MKRIFCAILCLTVLLAGCGSDSSKLSESQLYEQEFDTTAISRLQLTARAPKRSLPRSQSSLNSALRDALRTRTTITRASRTSCRQTTAQRR